MICPHLLSASSRALLLPDALSALGHKTVAWLRDRRGASVYGAASCQSGLGGLRRAGRGTQRARPPGGDGRFYPLCSGDQGIGCFEGICTGDAEGPGKAGARRALGSGRKTCARLFTGSGQSCTVLRGLGAVASAGWLAAPRGRVQAPRRAQKGGRGPSGARSCELADAPAPAPVI